VILNRGNPAHLINDCHQPEALAKLLRKSSVTTSLGTNAPQLTVYSTPDCPHCTSLTNYLKQLQVPFRDINVAADQQKTQGLVQKKQGNRECHKPGLMISGSLDLIMRELINL